MNTQRLILDLDKSSVPRGRVTIAQCDHDGTTVEAEIYDNGVALGTSGLSAYLVMRLPDGRHYYRVPATLDGHVATALVDEAYAATATGTTEIAYFELVGSGEVVYSTSRFGVRVLPSATADATVPESWDGEVERLIQQLDGAIETATDAANVANAAAANADATADGVESRVQEMAQDAAETATADAEQRIQDAIDAMGDISELAVPLMSKDIRGGAKLEEHGGLVLRDEKLGIGSLVQESDGAVRGSIAGLTAEGHAEQFSTTGKNLLDVQSNIKASDNGIYFSAGADGRLHISGTPTNSYAVVTNWTSCSLAAGSYVLSIEHATNHRSYVEVIYSDSTKQNFIIPTGDTSIAATFEKAATSIRFILSDLKTDVAINEMLGVQLELGSTATSYEPYTGGAPSPSPDYPQEIQVVRGRNLLPVTLADIKAFNASGTWSGNTYTINGVTFTVNSDGSVTVNGTSTNLANITVGNISNTAGNMYTASGCTGGSNSTYLLNFFELNNGAWAKDHVCTTSVNTFTAQYNKIRCDILVRANTTVNNVTFYPQLEAGSTTQPYVPYGYVGLEVQGKNLLDISTSTGLYASDVNIAQGDAGTVFSYIVPCVRNTDYTLTHRGGNRTRVEGTTSLPASGVSSTTIYSRGGEVTPLTFNSGANDYLLILLGNSSAPTWAQLELGSTATSYEPYHHTTTPIPLPSRGWVGSLPDGTPDMLTLDGAGKVEWELTTYMMILDGSEGWQNHNAGVTTSTRINSNRYAVYANNEGFPLIRVDNRSITSHFVKSSSGDFGIYNFNIDGWYVFFDMYNTHTLASFKSWLSANNVTCLYNVATPVTEECGYVDMPAIPSYATVSIPELDALGVKYFVDDSAGTLARQWYDREVNESDESLAQSIAMIESTTAKSNHAVNSYFMLDNVLRKATSAIASGETISNSNSSPITVEQVITALNASIAALEKEVVFATTPSVSHRNIYRGKNLGTVLTTAQKAQIAAGTFDDLYVGDYWTINGRVYRIADIDYYYNVGDTAFTKHHLVIVPDASFGYSAMNDSNTTNGAYVGSKMYTSSDSVLNTARNTISNDFGSCLASHEEYLSNVVDSSGAQAAGTWYSSTVELMNEPMVYGCFIHAKPTSDVGHMYTIDKSQLALFRLNPAMVNLRYIYWLRDVVSSTFFAAVGNSGAADVGIATFTGNGVRPFFCIVGD